MSVKSPVGAIGVMQLMPDVGKEMNVGDITQETANIHAGIKYFRSMVDKLYANEPMDDLNKVLFIYVWINNVEVIAAARVGAETVTYVSNIYNTTSLTSSSLLRNSDAKKPRNPFSKRPLEVFAAALPCPLQIQRREDHWAIAALHAGE